MAQMFEEVLFETSATFLVVLGPRVLKLSTGSLRGPNSGVFSTSKKTNYYYYYWFASENEIFIKPPFTTDDHDESG